jgi:hypothetical protein
VANGRAATSETLFRIRSTSKAFVSLAILMLADQGKLSLDDPVRKLPPEVWFENRWEADDPVRVVHLLEHTTGWHDMHLREYAKDAPGSMGLREALDYDHHSREASMMSGWVNVVLTFPRYFLISGLTILALVLYCANIRAMGNNIDFEHVLRYALGRFVPMGLLGFLVAGLLAAFMSNFAATVNAAPPYFVNDIYKRFISPNASPRIYV